MYQIAILDVMGDKSAVLRSTLESRVKDLNLDPNLDFEFLTADDLDRLRADSAKVGVLFSDSSEGQRLAPQVERLLDSSAVVIPVVASWKISLRRCRPC
jgi:glycosyltransferase involved in cell wall biosynthesis